MGDIGALIEMALGYTIIFSGVILLAAGWRQIYKGVKEDRMVTDGLYQYVRHPQYTGIFIAVFGQLVHWPTLPSLVLAPVIFFMYYRLALREERQVAEKYGVEYEAYAARTPRFFPKAGAWRTMFSVANSIEPEQ